MCAEIFPRDEALSFTESEKEYDRRTAPAALKAVTALDYRISQE